MESAVTARDAWPLLLVELPLPLIPPRTGTKYSGPARGICNTVPKKSCLKVFSFLFKYESAPSSCFVVEAVPERAVISLFCYEPLLVGRCRRRARTCAWRQALGREPGWYL